jgi:hypothetical protein
MYRTRKQWTVSELSEKPEVIMAARGVKQHQGTHKGNETSVKQEVSAVRCSQTLRRDKPSTAPNFRRESLRLSVKGRCFG